MADPLQDKVDRWLVQVRRERDASERRDGPADGFRRTVVDERVTDVIRENSGLSPDDSVDLAAILEDSLDAILFRRVGVPDPTQGEAETVATMQRLGSDVALRAMVATGVMETYQQGADLVASILDKANTLKADVDTLVTLFAEFDRDGFDSVVDIEGPVFSKVPALQVKAVAVVASAKAINSFSGIGFQVQDLCRDISEMFDLILAPGTIRSRLLALIARIERSIILIIDLILEVLELIEIAQALRSRVESSGSFAVRLRVLEDSVAVITGLLAATSDLEDQPDFARFDILRRFAFRLKVVHESFCRYVLTTPKLISFSVGGNLLAILEGALGPLLTSFNAHLVTYRDGLKDWLLGLRAHVQTDTGSEFTKTVSEMLAEIEAIVNTANVLKAAVAGPIWSLSSQEDVGDVLASSGLSGSAKKFKQGDVLSVETETVATATVAGDLAVEVAKKRSSLETAGELTGAKKALIDGHISYLANRHRAQVQSASIRSGLSSDAFASQRDDLDVAEAVGVTLRDLFGLEGSPA